MNDLQRTQLTGTALAVPGNDIDTDRIIPARFLKCVVFDGLGAHAFADDRAALRQAGKLHPFDDPARARAKILLVNKNFGCGSSREHAPQALMRWGDGITAVVGESFAEIFFGNCLALGIPCVRVSADASAALMAVAQEQPAATFTVDLVEGEVRAANVVVRGEVPASARAALVEGRWDSTAELLAGRERVVQVAAGLPYFQGDPNQVAP
ncbi:MAG: 3-isopropylmalate dehydratase small subunit [Myxococcales bacterium FL481]|nr:MAG: 3-isopropylmalate dehydratase small subunit [Myxococcales bacterium FL481]